MKNFYLFILASAMTLSSSAQVWDGTSSTWTNGDGSETSPYLIEIPQHLAFLSEQVRNGETYEGKYFRLAADLDMGMAENKHKFNPIGFFDEYVDTENNNQLVDDSKYFLGVFDGNYKTIDNINVYFVDTENQVGGTGLFACISDGAIVKNLTLGANSVIEGAFATGGLVGATTGGLIENCRNDAQIVTDVDGVMGVGGIVGALYGGTISGCINTSDISSVNNIGGIAGFVDRQGIIGNCYNSGNISFSGFYAGGIAGYLSSGSCKNSYNTGKILSDFSGQAVIGTTDAGVTIENCYYLTISEGATDDNEGVTAKSEEEMKSAEFLTALDNGQDKWMADQNNINSGYPVLKWQVEGTSGLNNAVTDMDVTVYSDNNNIYVNSESDVNITVYDISGKIVENKRYDGHPVYMKQNGIYIVKVYNGTDSRNFKVSVR